MAPVASFAADLIQNVYGRDIQSLNGKWAAIPDLYDQGERMKIYENNKPTGKTDFYEYSFEGGMRLNVPGDWNSQSKELKYYEGTVWYQRTFTAKAEPGTRRFLYFAGVSTRCNIYLNGKKIISHEGSFTPFQIEVTNALKDGENLLVCEVNNNRRVDAIPAMSYDWWNYGGITRDVMLVTVPTQYIADYFVRLEKGKKDVIALSVSLSEAVAGKKITVKIPELKVNCEMTTDAQGKAEASVKVRSLQRWSPESPKLYNIEIASPDDKVTESIGFRNIDTRGTKVFLNDKEIFCAASRSMRRYLSAWDAPFRLPMPICCCPKPAPSA